MKEEFWPGRRLVMEVMRVGDEVMVVVTLMVNPMRFIIFVVTMIS